jgi:hypothetical protein
MSDNILAVFEAKNVMLDIESCGDVVLSIGAVHFDPHTGQTLHEFEVVLSVEDQIQRGLQMSGGAFFWWLKQSEAARFAITNHAPGTFPGDAISDLRTFVWNRYDETYSNDPFVWAYPTSFDLPLIHRLAQAYQVRTPWKWTQTMDARTLWQLAIAKDKAAAEIEAIDDPDRHTALSDARRQAGWVARYLRILLAEGANGRADA